jgi:hypothetical protein
MAVIWGEEAENGFVACNRADLGLLGRSVTRHGGDLDSRRVGRPTLDWAVVVAWGVLSFVALFGAMGGWS